MEIKDILKSEILRQYPSMREFARTIKKPQSTLQNIFKRPSSKLENTGVALVIEMCDILNIDVYYLLMGLIVPKSELVKLTPKEYQLIQYIRTSDLSEDVFSYIEKYININKTAPLKVAKSKSDLGLS